MLFRSRQLCVRLQTVLNAAKSLAEEMQLETGGVASGVAPEVVEKIDAWLKTVTEGNRSGVGGGSSAPEAGSPTREPPNTTRKLRM